MTGAELIRRLRKLARRAGTTFSVDLRRGKGSHAMVAYAGRRSTVPMHSGDLPRGTLRAILDQLGVGESEI
jgi:predicted RNA binding protein YcfA (HicA-like mRNA interferase family)